MTTFSLRTSLAELIAIAVVLGACIQPASRRSADDLEVGSAVLTDINVQVRDGLAAVREFRDGFLLMWAQAPIVHITLDTPRATQLRLEIRNCLPDAQLQLGVRTLARLPSPHPVWCYFDINVPAGSHTLELGPPDGYAPTEFQFANMGDIQTAMNRVDEVFAAISAIPDVRFVMSTGDITELGQDNEYQRFEEQLASLTIPFYSTIGNHELAGDIRHWHQRYGRYSIHFRFKNVDFSYVDSGNASLDTAVTDNLNRWSRNARNRVHIFGTHYPPVDPVGARAGDFRSRLEAFALLSMLAQERVDLALYGHIHSYYEFSNAGIPSYISGGGGALPERFDGVGRHFLVINVSPADNQISSVTRVDVDH